MSMSPNLWIWPNLERVSLWISYKSKTEEITLDLWAHPKSNNQRLCSRYQQRFGKHINQLDTFSQSLWWQGHTYYSFAYISSWYWGPRHCKCGSISTAPCCPSVMHSLQMQEEDTFFALTFLQNWLAVQAVLFLAFSLIPRILHLTELLLCLLTEPFGLQASNTWCCYQTWHLFFIPRHWFSTHRPTYFIEKTVSTICKVLIEVTLKPLPENLQP